MKRASRLNEKIVIGYQTFSTEFCIVNDRDANLWRSNSLFFTTPGNSMNPTPLPTPDKYGNGTLYEVLHEVHTIKIHDHRFDARNNLCQ